MSMGASDDLIRGRAAFVSDLTAGSLRAAFVRSPLAHACIQGIDCGRAERSPGVRLILSAKDLADLGALESPIMLPGFEARIRAAARPPLAAGRVCHVGDPVALVVAETEEQAMDAAGLVEVDYVPLPALADVEQALAPAAPQLHSDIPGNVAFRSSIGDAETVAQALAQAHRRVSLRVRHNRVAPMPIEVRAARAEYDRDGQRYLFDIPSQGPAMMRDALARALRVTPAQVVVRTPHVGGSFGMKAYPYPEYVAVAAAARLLGRPVFWAASRNESFQSDTQGRQAISDVDVGLNEQGRIIAFRIDHAVDLGAYISFMAPHTATHGLTSAATGLYGIEAVHVTTAGVVTTTPWTDAYRGAGKPEAVLVIEQTMDAVARSLNEDPADTRRRHLIPRDRLPFVTPGSETYDSGDFPARLQDALSAADIAGFAGRCAAALAQGRVRGLGLCCWLDVTSDGPPEIATLRLDHVHGLSLNVGSHDTGQDHDAGFKAILREVIGLADDMVRVPADSSRQPAGGGTYGAKTLVVAGSAVHSAAQALRAAGLRRAAALFGGSEDDVSFEGGVFSSRASNRRLDWDDLVAESPLDGQGVSPSVSATYPNGCHVCEVEIDPATGEVLIAAYTAVDDFGRCLDHAAVTAQVVGGIAQGIGQALKEEIQFDRETGQLMVGSLMDYGIMHAADMPPVMLHLVEDQPCRTNRLGVKGCGQAGAIAALGAVLGAVNNALAGAGGAPIDAPATPAKLWTALNGRRSDSAYQISL